LKKKKSLSFKKFTPVKKSKFIFLYVNIFRGKNGDRREKGRCFYSSQAAFSKIKAKLYDNSAL
jgi:hypothetical protein